ncbi:hypothetical protein CH063_07462 [Colletotrichum higginsianum]|uniref:Histone chaperone domain-containing protein n=3 Tax=Colletotrichum destructivum species complex TaxID=2707350 RepID=H1V691_COLHI|nr:hypothetical protein CH63R_12067 [Colletotrichum higginsianum IMI 349063]TIC94344.1 hypothetical protein CH35J_009735 [Colletotrichum higginsianum]WQF85310.1 hypothetical protein CDEST_10324 [Colletotrichum destructivum]OBR05364.1 hypothetical protein CH63R_12067 [Colletotrichum higginsianum IMI 349063]CCF35743.1 hypothetical protein CH063_07462 [Colletotrichum higginsianum]GJC99999.1 hypothetical protein ColKHC_08825 [Colletotrichum higginsianum]
MSSNGAPTGEVSDNEYVSRQGDRQPIDVVSDETKVEDPTDPETADSDAQLERDDKEAIDKSNIVKERTRGAQPAGEYREPGDTEGLEDSRLE